jgi:hypothetical protein
MPGVDTNVLVRWLVDDEPGQTARVAALFDAARAERAPLFVPNTVMLELEWVLRSRHRFDKPAVLRALNACSRPRSSNSKSKPPSSVHCTCIGSAPPSSPIACTPASAARHSDRPCFDRLASKMPGVERLQA